MNRCLSFLFKNYSLYDKSLKSFQSKPSKIASSMALFGRVTHTDQLDIWCRKPDYSHCPTKHRLYTSHISIGPYNGITLLTPIEYKRPKPPLVTSPHPFCAMPTHVAPRGVVIANTISTWKQSFFFTSSKSTTRHRHLMSHVMMITTSSQWVHSLLRH